MHMRIDSFNKETMLHVKIKEVKDSSAWTECLWPKLDDLHSPHNLVQKYLYPGNE